MSCCTVDRLRGIFPYALIFVIICLFNAVNSEAQTLLMGTVGRYTIAGNEQFYDSGGAELDYVGKTKEKTVLCAPQDKSARIKFTEFELENAFDILYAYRGSSESGQFIREYTGTKNPGEFIVSAGECICFVFTSDGTNEGKGWEAELKLGSEIELNKGKPIREVKEVNVIEKNSLEQNASYKSEPRNLNAESGKSARSQGESPKRIISREDFENQPAVKQDFIRAHPELYDLTD